MSLSVLSPQDDDFGRWMLYGRLFDPMRSKADCVFSSLVESSQDLTKTVS